MSKKTWTLPPPGPGPESVNVHIECRGPGRIQLDVEPDPYEGSLAKRPERMRELADVLKLKSKMHQAIRQALGDMPPNAAEQIGLSFVGVRDPKHPATCMAARFDLGLSKDCQPEEHADALAKIVEVVTPVIDAQLRSLI